MDKIIFSPTPQVFICEFIDSNLGIGCGTGLMPRLLLTGFEPLEIVLAAFLAAKLPIKILKICIGVIVVLMVTFILIIFNSKSHFTWTKITVLETIAFLNKSISGGGNSSLVAQTLKKIPEKSGRIAVAIMIIVLGCLTLGKIIYGT